MPAKSQIISELGQDQLLLPALISRALSANDRVKSCFTVLQAAESHAHHPDQPAPLLASNGDEAEFARTVSESRRQADGRVLAPGAQRLRSMILEEIACMRAPLSVSRWPGAEDLESREGKLQAGLPAFDDDCIPAGVVDAITSADRSRGDTFHLLVMDLHKALNALQAHIADEDIDGARAWRVSNEDRPLVRAFMAGVNRTAPLKFEHPGLGTTATRIEERLVIQNDIGTTDAHVLMLQIENLTATLTYTDVHAARLTFFQSLFKAFAVRWDDTLVRHSEHLAEEANYYYCTGRFDAPNRESLERYLAFAGSRIVFLIDWNHARKRLREFVRKQDAVPLLKWAADQSIGHRGFLTMGGENLLYEAIAFAHQAPLRYGERLHEAIGPEAAVQYLKFVLRTTTEGLLQGRSERFIRDEVKAELAGCFRSANENLLSIASDHAVLIFELATTVCDELIAFGEAADESHIAHTARRAQKWEQQADALVSRVRSLVQQSHKRDVYLSLMIEADDVADGLEEVAYLMTLLPKVRPHPALLEPLRSLARLLVSGAQELVKLLETATHVQRDRGRENLQDFLEAVDRIVGIEHETDKAQRAMTSTLILQSPDFRSLQLLFLLGGEFEQAADALCRSALILRDHLLQSVVAG